MVDTFGTGKIDDEKIADIVNKVFDLRPSAIIDRLDLRKPIYKNVAAYGLWQGRPRCFLGKDRYG